MTRKKVMTDSCRQDFMIPPKLYHPYNKDHYNKGTYNKRTYVQRTYNKDAFWDRTRLDHNMLLGTQINKPMLRMERGRSQLSIAFLKFFWGLILKKL